MSLLDIAESSVLPEIYEVLGPDATIRFLETFAGMTIRIPAKEIFEEAMHRAEIYMRVQESEDEIRRVARDYRLTPAEVQSIYCRMAEIAKRLK